MAPHPSQDPEIFSIPRREFEVPDIQKRAS
jgi:hypothetical protein